MVVFLQALSVFFLWDGIGNTENDVDRGRVAVPGACHGNLDDGLAGNVQRASPWCYQLSCHRAVRLHLL